MSTGKVRVDMEIRETGAAASAASMRAVNDELKGFAALKLAGVVSLLGQAGQAMGRLWDAAKEGAEANNIQRVFERTVKDSARALEGLRRATAGTMDDTTLQKRAIALTRLGTSNEDQARIMEAVTKITVTSGKSQERVFTALMGAMTGSKDALNKFGVTLSGTGKPLDEITRKLAGVKVEEFSTSTAKMETRWGNAWSSMTQSLDNAVEGSLSSMDATLKKLHKDLNDVSTNTLDVGEHQDKVWTNAANLIAHVTKSTGGYSAAIWRAKLSQQGLNDEIGESIRLLEAAGKLGFQAAPGQSGIGKGEAGLNAAIKAENAKPKRKRRGGGGGRRGASGALEDDPRSNGIDPDTLKGLDTAALEKSLTIERLRLDVEILLGEKQSFRMVMLREEQNIARLRLQARQEEIGIEERDLGIQASRLRIKKEEAKQYAKFGKFFDEVQKGEKKAPKKTKGEVSLENQMSLYQGVGKAAMELAGKHAESEQERAAIGATMAVLDAGLAAVRIISENPNPAGFVMAAATMALGVATAAGYASAGGGASRGGGASPFQGFTATAINERPDMAGAPVVMNFNAPVVGGSSQEIAAQLGEYTDSGGMRRSAA